MRQMCDAAASFELPKARALNARLMPLHTRLFIEPNPIPVKWALQRMGKIAGGIRLPLVPLSASGREAVQVALDEAGLV
jgi:4-hydroxy-tetrahydrodipicolinate synthase